MTWLAGRCGNEEKPSPLPPFLLTFPCKNLTTLKISFKSHGTAVFLLNRSGRPLIGYYSSGPYSPRGIQRVAMFNPILFSLKAAQRKLKSVR